MVFTTLFLKKIARRDWIWLEPGRREPLDLFVHQLRDNDWPERIFRSDETYTLPSLRIPRSVLVTAQSDLLTIATRFVARSSRQARGS